VTPDAPADLIWELIGSRATFEELGREFYVGVASDEVRLPVYPEQPDLEGAIQLRTGLLEHYWGGAKTCSQEIRTGPPAHAARAPQSEPGCQ
tara:strand:+ start:1696 stop:1971 length:276 start_codon:yes stop_codon:yes gene_type:complete